MTQHKSEKEMYSYYLAFMKNYYQVITLLTAQAMCITTIKNLTINTINIIANAAKKFRKLSRQDSQYFHD